ncbi:putative ubiquitin hydrolase [Aspergillus campestris IBT 28561]|uniref:Ubiquitin carboxyl-terminal hydrolase n=1 Tax=Aspergillus campestris (strain IBT 28561) TaxID=1392248 RepID=A0A2I1DH40_ASPC2|nr:putative ubiquitin hydrolase [Aspergillus campestris IBT 28561]PKY09191.1 putative ubiquitin hydrolase [Aspergillus campestris IBT 28561]
MADGGGWSTIESDEGVFTSLVENLGVKGVQFEELISLDADTIRSLSPVYGVIFLFKWMRDQAPTQTTTTPLDGTYDTTPPENLFFAAQTIQNACGTQAQSQANPAHRTRPHPPLLQRLHNRLPPDLRGEALSNSEEIRTAHNAFAKASPFVDETTRDANEEEGDAYHFIAYTAVNGTLYELDGLQPYPISHGSCAGAETGGGEDFAEKVIGVLQRRIARYPEGETRFNLMAVVRDLRLRASEIGDAELMEREERKRRAWAWENTLRRSNFVGFIGEVLKGVAGMKEGRGEFEEWVEKAKGETQRRLNRR